MKRFFVIFLALVFLVGILPAYAVTEWKCDKCNAINDGKFCGECGSPKSVWTCSECSKENTTKYCSYCGVPKEYSDGTHALNNKEFEKAADIFSNLNYGDSKAMHIMAIGQWGVQLWEQKQYDDAVEKAEYVNELFMSASAYDSTFLVENEILYLEMCIFSYFAYSSVGDVACEEGSLGYAIHMYEQAYSFLEQIPAEDLEEFGGRDELFYSYAEWLMQVQSYELAAKWYEKCGTYLDSMEKTETARVIPLEKKYQEAVALQNSQKYEAAISIFAEIASYRDSASKISACEVALLEENYDIAVHLMNDGQFGKAYDAFIALGTYKDSETKATSIYENAKADKMINSTIGDYVFFGTYEQDNNISNGKEDIEWLVLAKEDSRILVISRYALDAKPYNDKRIVVTWEECTLRKWLNNYFLKEAFSSTEQEKIPAIGVSGDKNPYHNTDPGKTTQDRIFLLSILEANEYFSFAGSRVCKPTAYAVDQGVNTNNSGNCWWWLRSPAHYQDTASGVDALGSIGDVGSSVHVTYRGVRPALWINISP